MKFLLILMLIVLLFANCGKEECPVVSKPIEKYEQNVFEFTLWYTGNGKDICGWIILAKLDSADSYVSYKGVNIPQNIMEKPLNKYKGTFEILPEKYTCKDASGDPIPGQDSKTLNLNFVNILSWEKK